MCVGVRLRQIALVGQDLDWSVATLTAVLDTYVAFRDPTIVPAFGGLFNALLPVGDCFLEIVSPTDGGLASDSTSTKLLRKSGGDCGYMVILQVDDIASASLRMAKHGRLVMPLAVVVPQELGHGTAGQHNVEWKLGDSCPKDPGTTANVMTQWHPKDFGTLLELEEQWPAGPGASGAWLPAGNRWQTTYGKRSSSVCQEFAGVDVAVRGSPNACEAFASKWAAALDVPLGPDGRSVQLDGSVVRFVEACEKEGVVAVELYATQGKPKAFNEIHVHGITFRLVDRPSAPSAAPFYKPSLTRAKL